MSKGRYTCEQMIEALHTCSGRVYRAAARLRCSSTTVYRYIEKHPTVKAAKEEEDGKLLDLAEGKLETAINAGDPWAIKFYLRTKGRERGFGEWQTYEHKGLPELDINAVLKEIRRAEAAERARTRDGTEQVRE